MKQIYLKAWLVSDVNDKEGRYNEIIHFNRPSTARRKYCDHAAEVDVDVKYTDTRAVRNKQADLMVNIPREEVADLTEEQLATLQHFVGYTNSETTPHRNLYRCDANGEKLEFLQACVLRGWAEIHSNKVTFSLTDLGLDIVNSSLPIRRDMM